MCEIDKAILAIKSFQIEMINEGAMRGIIYVTCKKKGPCHFRGIEWDKNNDFYIWFSKDNEEGNKFGIRMPVGEILEWKNID